MRWKIFAGFFVFIFVFILVNSGGVYSLGEDLASCISDTDDLSYFTLGYLTLTNGVIVGDFCLESPNNKYLVEFTCDNGKTLAQYYSCALSCFDGKCVSDPDAQNIPNDGPVLGEGNVNAGNGASASDGYSVEEVNSGGEEKANKCEGCLVDGKCFSEGTRIVSGFGQEKSYCGLNGIIRLQKAEDFSCEANYECLGNVCLDGKCKSSKTVLSEASFFEKGLVKLSCLFTNGEKKNSCLIKNAKQWGII